MTFVGVLVVVLAAGAVRELGHFSYDACPEILGSFCSGSAVKLREDTDSGRRRAESHF